MATESLLDWILSILRNPDQRAAFQDNPDDFAGRNGFGDLSSADVHDALWLIADNQSASFDNDHGVHYPPPQDYNNNEHAGNYLNNYISNNYKIIDDRDTNIDDSVNQKIDTHGGDFAQTIDNDPVIASGDGAVAAGGDIRDSTLTSGNGNVVGDDNQVSGAGSTTAFGQGDAITSSFDDARFGDGSAVSVGGDASGSAQDNDTTTSVRGGDGPTSVNVAGTDANADANVDQSQSESSVDQNFDDHSKVDSNNETGSHNELDTQDSHNVDLHP